jgi:hypothetical protein
LGSALCPSSGILKTRKHYVSETGSVSFLRYWEGYTYSVGSHTITGPLDLRTETDPVSETYFLVFIILDDGKSLEPQ